MFHNIYHQMWNFFNNNNNKKSTVLLKFQKQVEMTVRFLNNNCNKYYVLSFNVNLLDIYFTCKMPKMCSYSERIYKVLVLVELIKEISEVIVVNYHSFWACIISHDEQFIILNKNFLHQIFLSNIFNYNKYNCKYINLLSLELLE